MPENLPLSLDLAQAASCAIERQAFNHFALRLADGVAEGQRLDGGKSTLFTGIWVDGKHIDEPHFVDLPLLVQSLHVPNWYEIFTCGCGVGGCAGIVDGIQVSHDGGLIRWSLRRPQSAGRFA